MIGQILGDVGLVHQLDHFRFLGLVNSTRSSRGSVGSCRYRYALAGVRSVSSIRAGGRRRWFGSVNSRWRRGLEGGYGMWRSGSGSGRSLALASVRITPGSIWTFGRRRRRRGMSCWWIRTAVAFQSGALADGVANAHVALGKHGVVLALGVVAVLALPG